MFDDMLENGGSFFIKNISTHFKDVNLVLVLFIFYILFLGRILLTRFYYCMNKDINQTKKLIEDNYALRKNAPNMFINRDPTDEDTKNTTAYL